MPVYQVEAYLERCVDSILQQTYRDWRLILVDDGSADGCPEICDRYADRYENITVIHQQNGGLSAARNAGIAYALQNADPEKDWISFIDSDDFVHPQYLEQLVRAAREAQVEVSICRFSVTGDLLAVSEACSCLSPETLWCQNHTNAVVAWGKLYRLRLFRDVRYPVGKIYEDNFTTHKLLFGCPKVAVTEDALYCWCPNPESTTRSAWSPRQLDAIEALETQLAFFEDKGYPKAYVASVRELFRHCVKQCIAVGKLSPEYDRYLPELREKRKNAFRLLVKKQGLIAAAAYWIEIRIIKSAKRVLRRYLSRRKG